MNQPADTHHFEQILQHLQQTRGFDFTAYKRPSLMRRVLKRMQTVHVDTFEEYFDYLQVHQGEFAALFNTILINVTDFFRDRDVWDYLRQDVLPRILDTGRTEQFRVWSAGCASGQEAYSLVMLLAELLGPDVVRDRVKVYATDVDEEALNEARLATYSGKQVEQVPPEMLDKYFDRAGATFTFKRDLRRSVIFGRHDLVQDAPISRVDLLLCRNTLMYFNADAQERILARFFFSLNAGGHILLGRAEMLFSHSTMFTPVDLKRRLFTVLRKTGHRERLLLLAQAGRDLVGGHSMAVHNRLREAAFETDRSPQIVVDAEGLLVAANAPARDRLGVSLTHVGRPFHDLEVSFRPADIRAAIGRATDLREEVTLPDVAWMHDGESRSFKVVVSPLFNDEQAVIGARATYIDVTELTSLQLQLQQSKQELETAYEELQSTNEELETTNEELQSTVEELETTNEELQSTNEELETMNEELQSTNEELHSMNDELRSRSTDLNAANAFLESVFASLRSAVIVVDADLRIQVWNDRSTDLWGVRSDEAEGTHLLDLDVGFDVTELRQPVREVLNSGSDYRELTLSGVNRRGKPILCRITVGPLRHIDRSAHGAILLMDEQTGQAAG